LVVRKSLKNISLQVINYSEKGDMVVACAHSSQLKKLGWIFGCSNLPCAYLTGLMLGKKAHAKNIQNIILDAGMHKPTSGSRIYAAVQGVLDAGIDINHTKDILPAQERILGKHIEKYAHTLEKDDVKYKKQFNNYLSSKANPKEFTKNKNKLLEEK